MSRPLSRMYHRDPSSISKRELAETRSVYTAPSDEQPVLVEALHIKQHDKSNSIVTYHNIELARAALRT